MTAKASVLLAMALTLCGGTARAGDCERVLAAGLKSLSLPSTTTTTTTGFNVMPKTAIVITVDGKRYAQRTNRGWTVSAWNPSGEAYAFRHNFGPTDTGCDAAGSETIDGAAADIFDSRYLNADGMPVRERLWISQATGLPVREEVHMGSGTFTVTLTTTMQYQDVHAPTGVTIRPGDDTVPDVGADPDAAQQTSPSK